VWDEYIVNGLETNVTSGAVGSIYTISGSNGTNTVDWSNLTISSAKLNPSTISQSGVMELRGEKADIVVNGQSLMSMMQQIQERLNILTVNADLETEWDELRELGRQYRELEQHIKDKMATWQKLKAQDQDNR
jgi:CRISPR/Cas system-associated protein Cas10 (large subunit of type III CRISPR-Cas system)